MGLRAQGVGLRVRVQGLGQDSGFRVASPGLPQRRLGRDDLRDMQGDTWMYRV